MIFKVVSLLLITLQLSALRVSSIKTISEEAIDIHFAANEKGNAILCWRVQGDEGEQVMVSIKPKQGDWSSPQTIAQPGWISDYGNKLYCTIDVEGNPYVFWQAQRVIKNDVGISVGGPDRCIEGVTQLEGSWSKAVVLSDKPGLQLMHIGLDREEKPFLFLEELKSYSITDAYSFHWTPWSTDFKTPYAASSSSFPYHYTFETAIATFPNRDPFVACVVSNKEDVPSDENPSASIYEISCKNKTSFFADEKIAEIESEAFYFFQAIMDGQERRALIWMSGENDESINVMTKTDGKWSQHAFQNQGEVNGCNIAFDDKGNILAVWTVDVENSIQIAYKPLGKPWLSPITLASSANLKYRHPKVQFDHDQNFVILWSQGEKWSQIYGTLFSTVTQTAQVPGLLSPPNEICGLPFFAFHEKGKGIIAWVRVESENSSIQTAELYVE